MKIVPQPFASSFGVLVLVAIASCAGKLTEPPEITPPPDAESTDVVFLLAHHARRADGIQVLSASGRLQGRPVGFELELTAWQENPPGYVNMSTWECKATLRSLGVSSDDLLRFLATLYGVHESPAHMIGSVELQALSPWKNPGDFTDGGAKFILLFPPTFEIDRPAEVWVEVDTKRHRIILREKEKHLRRTLIDTLTASI